MSGRPDETDADRLQTAVDELAQNVRVLTDIVDRLREDLSWLTRNGVPHQPITVLVHRMPRVSAGEGGRGTLELSLVRWPVRDPTAETLSDDQVRAVVVEEIVQRLAEPLGELAQEQLNALVDVIDHAHREVLHAIRTPRSTEPEQPAPAKSRGRKSKQPAAPVTPTIPVEPPPPSGHLF